MPRQICAEEGDRSGVVQISKKSDLGITGELKERRYSEGGGRKNKFDEKSWTRGRRGVKSLGSANPICAGAKTGSPTDSCDKTSAVATFY